ncbi:MAG: MFS transporter [SAR324 cluster bacterium]|uniref:MFS transporter n=1 Tax=SAR324 cluster bacterium TaxID=2024889 RepID=A0A432HC04_9DELT|nr:MAG: MFS transporter [SAR324 cluster bacterium]
MLLSLCFALTGTTSSLTVSASPLVGFQIADNQALATLPLSFHLIGTMLAGIPASFLMKNVGRRYGFMIGTGIGAFGAASAAGAIIYSNFYLFCLSIFCLGILSGFGQLYRFAAADVATNEFKTKAVSLVMIGGIIAGFIGPTVASKAKDLIPNAEFAGSYLFVIMFHFLIVLILLGTRLPRPDDTEQKGKTRPLKEIFSQPKFLVAVLSAMAGYGVMAMVMTATPLAMTEGSGHQFSEAAFVIQWHVVGMFAPSFFTGSLIHRYGSVPIIFTGILLNVLCIAINLAGTDVFNYWSSLILLGMGWNFMFVAGTTMVIETYSPAEKAIVQGVNDFLVFGTAAVSSLLAGVVQTSLGWRAVNLSSIPLLGVAVLALLWYIFRNAEKEVISLVKQDSTA